jgi:hypothetical protein
MVVIEFLVIHLKKLMQKTGKPMYAMFLLISPITVAMLGVIFQLRVSVALNFSFAMIA